MNNNPCLLEGYFAFNSTTVAFEQYPLKRALKTKHIHGIITWMDLEVDSFSEFLKWSPCGYCACQASSKQPWFLAQCRTAQQQRNHSRVRLWFKTGRIHWKCKWLLSGTLHSPLSRRASKSDLRDENKISKRVYDYRGSFGMNAHRFTPVAQFFSLDSWL